jgi:hypothetical protein
MLIAILTALPSAGLPMGSRPDDVRIYHFDGSQFRGGNAEGMPAIETRTGRYPLLLQNDTGVATPLPAGTGALAGICYLQQGGGKLGSHPDLMLRPGIQVTVRGAGVEMRTSCDSRGFFSQALPPGRYEVSSGADTRVISIEADKTTLTPLRGGKRMVD